LIESLKSGKKELTPGRPTIIKQHHKAALAERQLLFSQCCFIMDETINEDLHNRKKTYHHYQS